MSRRECDSSRSVSFIITVPLGDIGATPDATVPALPTASGPRANSGAGQTMHAPRSVRRKYERRNGP
jgi:hypothetical protein